MITDLTLRWVVTVLFVLSAAECLYAIAVGRRTPLFLLGQGWHVLMAVAMAVMAWPRGAELPTTGPMIVFLVATAWFVGAAVIEAEHWAPDIYHALMMLAMAWMYAAMNGAILPGQQAGQHSAGHHHGHAGVPMPGMDTAPPAEPPYIGALNWFWTVFFAAATLWWFRRYVVLARTDGSATFLARLGALSQAGMGAGMAVMFAVML